MEIRSLALVSDVNRNSCAMWPLVAVLLEAPESDHCLVVARQIAQRSPTEARASPRREAFALGT